MKVLDWLLISMMFLYILIGMFIGMQMLINRAIHGLPPTPGTYVLHYDGKRYEPVPFDKAFKDMAEGLREKTLKEGK